VKDIKRILGIIFVSLLFILIAACSDGGNYSVSIRQIDCKGTICNIDLNISAPGRELPLFLVTIDRPPVDGNDGLKFRGTEASFELKGQGTHVIYVTLIEGKRFLTTPVSVKTTINLEPPDRPVVRWSLAQGLLTLDVKANDSKKVTDYRILVNDVSYRSSSGVFSVPVERDTKYIVQAFSMSDTISSEPAIVDLELSEDFAPEVKLFFTLPYRGDAIQAEISDDWDSPEEIEIEAFAQESGISLLFDGARLIPEIPIPEGMNTLVVRVSDSSGNTTEVKKQLSVVKNTSPDLPELYIEEGTIRNARWTTSEGFVQLQRYRDGEWITLSSHDSEEKSSIISKDSISENGDLYRIAFTSENEIYMPSVPVFAKESFFRRFSTEFISSFLGMDALLVGGNDYRFYGNIVVRDNSVMRVESGSSLTIPKGNTLLVSGVLDLEGRKDRIAVNPGGSSGTIEVTNNGVLIARSVDFNNSRILIEGAAVVVFEDCTFSGGLKISGARTVQIYKSQIDGEIIVENVRELLVHLSELSGTKLTYSNLGSALLSRSTFSSQSMEVKDSRVEVFGSVFESGDIEINRTSRLSLTGGSLIDTEIKISGASWMHIEESEISGQVSIDLQRLSRLTLQEDAKAMTEIISDEKSAIKVY